jgi:asparagine synthase (glutamine-hydrolysing)
MNRIAGILNLDHAPVHAGEVERMLRAMNHSGGDTQTPSIWVAGGMGLGCTRNAERSDHPIARLPHGEFRITFDGRIDNREQLLAILRPELMPGGARIPDEKLVLAAYAKWELDCARHLIGDFAFAVWDPKKQRLICGRDHFGVKPFYYSLVNGCFVFASTPLAILDSGKVPPQIHEERIADHLVNPLEGVDKTSSFYEDVFRLPPAHILVVQAGEVRLRQYWELCPAVPAGVRTEQEYIEAFHEIFAEVVQCRLRDVREPASMLSGGMDSSAIVGMGRNVLAEEGRCLHALAVSYPDTNRETAHISSMLNQGNLQQHLISEIELSGCIGELAKAIEGEAEPFDCLMNLNRAVYLHSREQGFDVVLDGVDGDILLSDSGYLTQLWRKGEYRTLVEETLKADGLIAEYKLQKKLFFNSLLSMVTLLVPDWIRSARRQRRYQSAVDHSARHSIIDRGFAARCKLGERFAMLDSHQPRPASWMQVASHKIALEHPFLTVGLERYGRVASAFGIEARHPFTDIRLAEFCLGLPWQLKTRGGWTKMILRRAMEPYLPSEVIWRKDKDSLMWEVNRLVLKARAEYFHQVTLDQETNLRPYVDTPKLKKYWQDYLTHGDETHVLLIWSGIALALWLRRHRHLTGGLQPA